MLATRRGSVRDNVENGSTSKLETRPEQCLATLCAQSDKPQCTGLQGSELQATARTVSGSESPPRAVSAAAVRIPGRGRRDLSGSGEKFKHLLRHQASNFRGRRERATEWIRRERPPHDAVCVQRRCVPCRRDALRQPRPVEGSLQARLARSAYGGWPQGDVSLLAVVWFIVSAVLGSVVPVDERFFCSELCRAGSPETPILIFKRVVRVCVSECVCVCV